jgi:hypothetical protein
MSRRRSDATFEHELEWLEDVRGTFWDEPGWDRTRREYFESLREGGFSQDADQLAIGSPKVMPERSIFDGDYALDPGLGKLFKAARESPEDLARAIVETTGVSVEQAVRGLGDPGSAKRLATLTTKFGSDAFGTYLPWHAFARSQATPWGIPSW